MHHSIHEDAFGIGSSGVCHSFAFDLNLEDNCKGGNHHRRFGKERKEKEKGKVIVVCFQLTAIRKGQI